MPALDRELRAAGLPQTVTIPPYGPIRIRLGRIAGATIPMAWTDGHEKQFSKWWGEVGRRLGLSPLHYDLRSAFIAGLRKVDADGRPVFRTHFGNVRKGWSSELDVFRTKW